MLAFISGYNKLYGWDWKLDIDEDFIPSDWEISLSGTHFNAVKILALFFWKQAYKSFKWKGQKCVLLTYSPYVIWRNITDETLACDIPICTPASVELEVYNKDCNNNEEKNGSDKSQSISLYDPDCV